MKATIKNQIRLVIVVVCAVLLVGPAMAVAEETMLLASLSRTKQTEEFKDYDFFPEYHREARVKEHAEKERKMKEMNEIAAGKKIVSDAEWLSENVIIPYELLNADYVGLAERVISKTKNLF
jgi:hypothetical protein